MKVDHEAHGSGGRYVIRIDGHEAEMTYSRASPALIVVDHTGVADEMRGKGLAKALAAHAVEEARKGGWKIIPLCTFLKAQFDQHPEWHDVLGG